MKIYQFIRTHFFILFVVLIAFCLRFYTIATIPPGLYMDEVSIGNNAYAILTTGKDEFGTAYPLFFKAFGEYKMPLLIYLTSISLAIFGKIEFAIRFPSALFGSLTVFLFYFFIKEILILSKLQKEKFFTSLPLLGTLLLALSPLHIHFSRGGFEATVALFFYLLGFYCSVKYINNKATLYLFLSSFFFVVTLYTYFVYRVLSPVTLFSILVIFFVIKRIDWRKFLFVLIFIFMLSLPILLFSFSAEGLARFSQTSAFNEIQTKSISEKLYLYPLLYIKNYLSFFSLSYLFSTGDGIGRHQMPWFGILPLWQIPFLISGIYVLFKKRNFLSFTILGLLCISPLAGALALPSPHTLRNLMMVLPLTIVIAVGLLAFYHARHKIIRLVFIFILFLACLESILYIHFYSMHYTRVNQLDWGAGYKQMVQEAAAQKEKYAAILVDSRVGFAEPYFVFFANSIQPIIIDDTWKRPKVFEGKKLLFIRPYGIASGGKLIKNIYYPYSVNKDVFVQFWEI